MLLQELLLSRAAQVPQADLESARNELPHLLKDRRTAPFVALAEVAAAQALQVRNYLTGLFLPEEYTVHMPTPHNPEPHCCVMSLSSIYPGDSNAISMPELAGHTGLYAVQGRMRNGLPHYPKTGHVPEFVLGLA